MKKVWIIAVFVVALACGAMGLAGATPKDAKLDTSLKEKKIYSPVGAGSAAICLNQFACENDCCNSYESIDVAIITRPKFRDTLYKTGYLEWKKNNGYNVGVFTVEWIVSNYPGDYISQSIKKFIQALHDNKKTSYALLIGDAAVTGPDNCAANLAQLNQDGTYISNIPRPNSLIKQSLEYDWEVPASFYPRSGISFDTNGKPVIIFKNHPTDDIIRIRLPRVYSGKLAVDDKPEDTTAGNNTQDNAPGEKTNQPSDQSGSSSGDLCSEDVGLDLLPSDLPYASPVDFAAGEASVNHSNHPAHPYKGSQAGYAVFSVPITVYVGRFPVRTDEDLANIIYKTMQDVSISNFVFAGYDGGKQFHIEEDPDLYNLCKPYYPPQPTNLSQETIDHMQCVEALGFLYWIQNNNSIARQDMFKVSPAEIKQQILSLPSSSYFEEVFHGWIAGFRIENGNYDSITFTPDDVSHFSNTFPIFVSRSCSISAFYLDVVDPTLSEAIIRSKMGPMVFSQGFINEYFFYKSLLNGSTIGEAYYAGADYAFYGPNPYQLFGDPTLRLYKKIKLLKPINEAEYKQSSLKEPPPPFYKQVWRYLRDVLQGSK